MSRAKSTWVNLPDPLVVNNSNPLIGKQWTNLGALQDAAETIISCIDWKETPEGVQFWNYVYTRLINSKIEGK